MAIAPLTTVVINLHESAQETLRLMRELELNPDEIPARQELNQWQLHQRFRDDDLRSIFPGSGLRRVQAPQLIVQLTQAGFRHIAPTLIVGRSGKMYTEFAFVKDPSLQPTPHTTRLGRVLSELVWRRVRGVTGLVDGELISVIDLVQIQRTPQGPRTNLYFHPTIGVGHALIPLP